MTEMYDIVFNPFKIKGKARAGTTIFDAAQANNLVLRSDCGQKGKCGKCRVIVDNPGCLSPKTMAEEKILSPLQLKSSQRLACQAKIYGHVTITIPDELITKNEASGKTGIKGLFSVNPVVQRIFIAAEKMNSIHGKEVNNSLSEKIINAVGRENNETIQFKLQYPLKILGSNDIHSSDITIVNHEIKGVTCIQKGIKKTSLGFAFDIGTTTIAAYLCDLISGKIVFSKAMVNPQRQFGEDVISRIAAASEDEKNLEKQHKLVVSAMNDLINSCLETSFHDKMDIDEITVVGNTTMEHILEGLNPQSLGVYPYMPVTRSSVLACASDVGLDLMPATPVYIFPVISGFLGGDILSALLAYRSYTRKDTTLIIDIGTNGEIMLSNDGCMWATSCATGPALEGAQISCGMRASLGAVSKVFFDADAAGRISFETIGNARATGICGSGIIDALAAMRKAGITLENGTFNPDKPGVVCNEKGLGKKFMLPDSDIYITLKDVRQVQLAKAALFVGIESLIKNAGITRIDRIILTGAFGAKFNWKNARDIGMLPYEILEGCHIGSTGNLAGNGAVMALLDKDKRNEIENIARKVNSVDLSCEPDFTFRFSMATQFPLI